MRGDPERDQDGYQPQWRTRGWTKMVNYVVTFGQKYRTEPHPAGLWVHPDGWLTVEALDLISARETIAEALGVAWADLQSESQMLEHPQHGIWYPLRSLARLEDGAFTLSRSGSWITARRERDGWPAPIKPLGLRVD